MEVSLVCLFTLLLLLLLSIGRVRLSGSLEELDTNSQRTSTKKLGELGILSGDRLLLWTGTEVSLSNEIMVTVQYYAPQDDDADESTPVVPAQCIPVRTRDSTTLDEFAHVLDHLFRIAPGEQLICKRDSNGVKWLRDGHKTMYECNVFDGSVLTVEERVMSEGKKSRPISLAMRAYEQQENQLQLHMSNRFSEPHGEFTIECSKEDTINELKLLCMAHLPPDTAFESILLTWPNGATFSDGERSLMSYSIGTGNRLIVENAAISVKPIEVQFVVHLKTDTEDAITHKRNLEPHSIMIPSTATVAQAKAAMIKVLEKHSPAGEFSDKQYRLRRLNFMKELLAIIQDEARTLDEVDIYDRDLVCLEEGRVPVPGELTLYIQCFEYLPPAAASEQIAVLCHEFDEQALSTSSSSNADAAAAATTDTPAAVDLEALATSGAATPAEAAPSGDATTPATATEGGEASSTTPDAPATTPKEPPVAFQVYSPALFRPKPARHWEDIPESVLYKSLVPVYIARTESLAAMKQVYMDRVTQNLTSSDDGSLFEIRQLISDIEQRPDRIRVWDNGRLLSRDKTTLKKYGVLNGAILTIEFLPTPEQLSTNASLLYLYQWQPTATGAPTDSAIASSGEVTDSSDGSAEMSKSDGTATASDQIAAGDFVARGQVVFETTNATLGELKQLVSRSIGVEAEFVAT